VEQKKGHEAKAKAGPTPEDRSYAEWFAWAKRGGAPASACHAAAQGAFQALAGGKDVATAVQWATVSMSRPPVPVSAERQTYCAWFSLAHIDLNLDQHKAHAFGTAAVHALDMGADAAAAHAAGLAAAGVR
jgi:hypothetical protein